MFRNALSSALISIAHGMLVITVINIFEIKMFLNALYANFAIGLFIFFVCFLGEFILSREDC